MEKALERQRLAHPEVQDDVPKKKTPPKKKAKKVKVS